jgi:D-psicose/D-tagatose/L-ribulose 3-epimerase
VAGAKEVTVNPLGVHSLVWVGELSPEPLRGAVERSREAGFDLIELSLHDPGVMDVADTRAALAAAGLDVACSRGLDFDADISSDDPRAVGRGAVHLAESVRLTRELGGRYFGGALYSALGKYPARSPPAGGRTAWRSCATSPPRPPASRWGSRS